MTISRSLRAAVTSSPARFKSATGWPRTRPRGSSPRGNARPPTRGSRRPRRTADPCARFADRLQKERTMLETIAVILIVLWLLGLVTSYTMGGLIHALLV